MFDLLRQLGLFTLPFPAEYGGSGSLRSACVAIEELGRVCYNTALAPGMLVFTMAEGLLVEATMQHTALAFLEMEYKVERPVFAGDTIAVEVEVIEARLSRSRLDRGLVRTRNQIRNQHGEVVQTYTPLRMVRTRADAPAHEETR